MLYGQDSTDQILREFPAWAEAQVEDAMTRLNPGDHDELDYHVERRMAEDLATTALVEVARLAKDPGFSGEGETRVVAWSLSDGEFVRYRATRYGVVRYVELGAGSRTSGFVLRAENEPPETPLPITSVRIGPSPYAERGKASVQGLLKKYGCDHVELKLSKSQVR